ncbi:Putative cysteine protease YraA [Gemmata obscuriglobus]|uniref:Type 1 glutamine amidotransferase n=1 Tax=Gemmata obscuriglobus TaxID=114 RepID=A0A2Z3H1K0_9BACT|nr:type 1 glutamine amidotransferase domain-containing protein [Gemmata obscuriglobus]AWM39903.1 type 1 glutamine amidotransferase [Gemmata obscuriglobus]QEG26963.1 Putative cysteine protease YraA [Gemmata obscuriglobus]VTS03179.1 glutamine amidotransferase : Intracellular protease, PfpI family OS=Singulisphaera acidiphila (strain ATCC BAA-1392 / DSM 18658 / VKM B-2454 / MOB10) GN=Sinac_6090 PE=4 SV=1: DJ-1_PfpI [Gemmata obscuriglobus UQM 2246]
MSLTGKRVAVLVEQQYQEMEVWYPVYRLREAGCVVELVGPEAGKTYSSKLGYPAKATLAAKDAHATDFAAVVVPGGFAPDYIRRSEPMLKLVRDALAQNKPVAAICHGPWVLCSTTGLKGRKVTCFHSIKDDVVNAGGTYVDQEVCVDGNVITSRTPEDLPAFVVALIEMMHKG